MRHQNVFLRLRNLLAMAATAMALACGALRAAPVDFNTFVVEDFPLSKNPTGTDFGVSNWVVLDGGDAATESTNAANTVFYGPDNILGSRITGLFNPGTDDDMPGFVLGFNPGDAEGANPDANYLVIDWKGVDQNFDFVDPDGEPDFHWLTAGTFAPAGLAVSQVRGWPTADELWGHVDDPANPGGGVTELARGITYEFEGYDRVGIDYEFEIVYEPTRVQVFVDGELEIDAEGSFGQGRFGLYEAYQNPDPVWSQFDIEVFGVAGTLQPGDADQDLDFDQLDLVRVQIASKYLTGQAATWGEGDWNGGPGGQPGDPPPGDGLFNQLDIIAALNAGVYLTGPYGAVAAGGASGDGQTSIGYDAGTGEVWVDAPAGTDLTSVNIDSAGGIFTGEPAQNLGGSFDNDADNNIFKATFGSSFGSMSFGMVAQAGLSEDFVLGDLTVVGSLAGGGDLGNVDLIYVPEPSAMVLLVLGVLGWLHAASRRPTRAPHCINVECQ